MMSDTTAMIPDTTGAGITAAESGIIMVTITTAVMGTAVTGITASRGAVLTMCGSMPTTGPAPRTATRTMASQTTATMLRATAWTAVGTTWINSAITPVVAAA